ncbi:phage portal protein (plasmid) [Bacillus carboniphilus]|uniref:Phage portal protein n=1 Tax=Bacillus carboniphilus TaxID=86663 RepID=A0ABY9K188_9BACI|nr:phage portal protein [Bacillus carboniphilus]WLR44473.1 phage portal protein [Bacillus carboniphilus]
MGLYSFFKSWFTPEGNLNDQGIYLDLTVEYHVKKLAIQTSVNLIANALIRSQFRTFEKGKETKGNMHYLFNVEPNQNQNAGEFIHEFVSKLVYDNQCLVIMEKEQLYVADSFDVKEYAFFENTYKNIVVNDYKLLKTYSESDVLYFKLNNERIRSVIDDFYGSYGKLLSASMNYYKRSNALRVKLEMDGVFSQTNDDQEDREEMFYGQLKQFLEAEGSAVLPLQDGIKTEEFTFSSNGQNSRDIKAIVDDILDVVSMAFHIPKGLLKGDVAEVEEQTDNFVMFCVAPIAEIIQSEINRKMYTKKQYLERTYMKVDTRWIKYVDPAKIATALDKFVASGTYSINENRNLIGDEPLSDEWAESHHLTKNYLEVEEYMKGGDSS